MSQNPGIKALTVSQITGKIKGMLEMEIGEVWIQGEISGFKPSSSGHYYFNLKDESSLLNCALFKGVAARISLSKMRVEDGLHVLAHGRLSVYPPRGSYQLIVDHIAPMGEGALQAAFEKLKQKLQAEGLFDSSQKKKIPEYPSKIALITSQTGAALQDMLNVLERRNVGIHILIVPVLVQGIEAPAQILEALRTVNKFDLAEVIVLARGGGSIEDLWAFNDESVVRAVAKSEIPTISAVGHETDFTLCDFAADLRAPTPSAAAELVSKNRIEMLEHVGVSRKRLRLLLGARIQSVRKKLLEIENQMISPRERLQKSASRLSELSLRLNHAIDSWLPIYRQTLDELSVRLETSLEKLLVDKKRQFENLSVRLDALSPLKVLGRGYTLIESASSGRLVKSSKTAKPGTEVNLVFFDGRAKAKLL